MKHYAGDVIYNIGGFIEKNRDTLFQDFKRLLFNSKNPVIILAWKVMTIDHVLQVLRGMWPEGAEHITKTTKRPLTAGTLFKNSMLALMKIIHSKVGHDWHETSLQKCYLKVSLSQPVSQRGQGIASKN